MNCKQNEKINQVKKIILVVGIGIGWTTHYARVFDWRGIQHGKVFKFSNSREGVENFKDWIWLKCYDNLSLFFYFCRQKYGKIWVDLRKYAWNYRGSEMGWSLDNKANKGVFQIWLKYDSSAPAVHKLSCLNYWYFLCFWDFKNKFTTDLLFLKN